MKTLTTRTVAVGGSLWALAIGLAATAALAQVPPGPFNNADPYASHVTDFAHARVSTGGLSGYLDGQWAPLTVLSDGSLRVTLGGTSVNIGHVTDDTLAAIIAGGRAQTHDDTLAGAGPKIAPTNASVTFATVAVGTSSTPVLAAAATSRSKLYLANASGRTGATTATSTDCWCTYGGTAALNAGFVLLGGGDRVVQEVPEVIDPRAISCIAASAVTISVGSVQQ